MDSDQGKLFVGGLSWETNEEKLSDYFRHFGHVLETLVVRDNSTGRPRGFGFVVFSDPSILDSIIQDRHSIDGRTVEVKRAISREEQQKAGIRTGGRNSDNGGNSTKKIFVGGLPPGLTEDEFSGYFKSYGHVMDVVIMVDQSTQRPRGFGFVTFDTEEAVDRVLHKSFHDLNGKTVEVKRALPKDSYSGIGSHSGGGGGGYHGCDSLGSDDQSDGIRYMQQYPNGGFTDYGSGYGVQGFGFGPINNAVAYGGFGVVNYSMMGPGYNPFYGGYGNQNAGYSNDQYNASAFLARGQSQNGAATYGGDNGYGYYGGQDGSHASKSTHASGKGYANSNRDSDYTNTARSSNRSQNEKEGGNAGEYVVH